MKYILFFSESGKQDIPYIGRKAANLAVLFRSKFKVPPGFILSREVFDAIVEHKQIRKHVHKLYKCSDGEFDETADEVKKLIKNYEFPEDVVEEIVEAYLSLSVEFNMDVTSMLESDEVFVGIRHSFVGEELDNPRLVQKTILNVKGKARLLKAILETYSDKLIQYMENFREGDKKPGFSIALIVQKMVNAEKSGIAYPQDGEIVVKACFGLGQDFEHSSVYPDTYTVDTKSFEVRDIDVVDKQYAYVKDIDSDRTIKYRLGEKSTKQVLFNDDIIEIARLTKKVINSFGKEQQIEWAKRKDTIYIMKAKDKGAIEQEAVEMEVYGEEDQEGEVPEIIDISEPDFEEDLQVLEEIEQYEKKIDESETEPETDEEQEGEEIMIVEEEGPVSEKTEVEEIDIPAKEEESEQEGSIFTDYKGFDEKGDEGDESGEKKIVLDKFSELARMNAGNTVVYCHMSVKEKLRQKLQKHLDELPEEYDKLLDELVEYEPLDNEEELRKLSNIKKEFVQKMNYPEPEDVKMALRLMEEMN